MKRLDHIRLVLAAAILLSTGGFHLCAQPKSVGFTSSHFSYGITYDHWSKSGNFHNVQLNTDMDGLYNENVKYPGVSASYSYNFQIADTQLDEGGHFRFYAGPGVNVGWVKDWHSDFGITVGLKADVGAEYSSARIPVTVGGKLSPTLGLHSHMNAGKLQLSTYKNGLMKALMPEMVVKFDLGRQTTEHGFGMGDHVSGDLSFPRFTFGVESCYIPVFARYLHYNFVDNNDTRHFDNDVYGGFWSKGCVLANVGVNVTRNVNLAISSGFARFGSSFDAIPLLLRAQWFIGKDPNDDRWYTQAEIGPGFALEHRLQTPAAIGGIGGGYRLSLNKFTKLDLGLGLFSYCARPIYEDSVNTTKNIEAGLGLRFSTAVEF